MKLGVVLVLVGSLSACSTINPYLRTAEALAATGYEWVRRNNDDFVGSNSATDLEMCVKNIARQMERVREEGYPVSVPNRETRVLRLLECMQNKGWDFEYNQLLDEISVDDVSGSGP